MEPNFQNKFEKDKKKRYEEFLKQYAALIEGETDETAVMANTAAALKEAFDFFWVGFYRVTSADLLTVGPFQGGVACFRIRKGKGVCGTAWQEQHTVIVPDVNAFPGHIACSMETKSEIVVPLIYNNEVRAVIDIDSDMPDNFDDTDREYLEKVADLMTAILYT